MLNSESLYSNIHLYDNSVNRKKIEFAFDFAKSKHKGQFKLTLEKIILPTHLLLQRY